MVLGRLQLLLMLLFELHRILSWLLFMPFGLATLLVDILSPSSLLLNTSPAEIENVGFFSEE